MLGLGQGGLLSLVTPEGKVPGTGLSQIVKKLNSFTSDPATALLFGNSGNGTSGNVLDDIFNIVGAELPGQWGDYSTSKDVGPSAFFVVAYSLFTISYGYIFFRNWVRGHVFFPTFGLAVYTLLRVIAFGLRIRWSVDVTNVDLGLTATGLVYGPSIFICVMNMLFGLRIFTWRHPEFGKSKMFNGTVLFINVAIVAIFIMGLTGEGVPLSNFLTQKQLNRCHRMANAGSVTVALYSTMGTWLIGLAYAIRPGNIDKTLGWIRGGNRRVTKLEQPQTFSAGWIQSVGMLYFPNRGSQTRFSRDQLGSHAVRVISTFEKPAGGHCRNINGKRNQDAEERGAARIRTNIAIVLGTSALLLIGTSTRAASTFPHSPRGGLNGIPLGSWLFLNWPMYVFTAALECIINVIYLVMRVDLRFYIPDMSRRRGSGNDDENSGSRMVSEIGSISDQHGPFGGQSYEMANNKPPFIQVASTSNVSMDII